VVIDQACSTMDVHVNGQDGHTQLSGTVGLTIDPGCTAPGCSFSIGSMELRANDFDMGGSSVKQGFLHNLSYAFGTWQTNGFSLPDSSLTVGVSYLLDGVPSGITLTSGPSPLVGSLNRDYTNFTLTGKFGDADSSITLGICGHVVARPPVAMLTPSGTFQCNADGGAQVTFSSAQSSDPDNDLLYRVWKLDGLPMASNIVTWPALVPLGMHTISVTVMDSRLTSDTATQSVNVIDTTPPQLQPTVLPSDCLFPPNHKYVLFQLGSGIAPRVTDSCDAQPQVRIVSVSSNQPPSGGGSGNTALDYRFGGGAVCVRAERDGTVMTPREYTVTLEAVDGSGNRSRQAVVIKVPHDAGGGQKCDIKSDLVVEDDDPRCTQDVP
jgi:hypothetical protein